MYFWMMYVRSPLVARPTTCLISSMLRQTSMPFPRFVFSPGLMIQVFLGTRVFFFISLTSSFSW
jgi:hypothetical protein